MPLYFPIDATVPLAASLSDLIAFQWAANSITADFLLPHEGQALRVMFDGPCVVRLLDEMPLSTEEDGPLVGLVPEHFAYRIEGAAFASAQSATWKEVHSPVSHYRFVTGWACMDVLSPAHPLFSVVERPSPKSA